MAPRIDGRKCTLKELVNGVAEYAFGRTIDSVAVAFDGSGKPWIHFDLGGGVSMIAQEVYFLLDATDAEMKEEDMKYIRALVDEGDKNADRDG